MADGKLLTYAEYLLIENAYVNAVSLFMSCNNLTGLLITCLEKYWELRDIIYQ